MPKDAWINPHGGHLGRQVGVWPDPRIFKEVIIPWLVKTLEAPQRLAKQSRGSGAEQLSTPSS